MTDAVIHLLRRVAPHLGAPTAETDDAASSAAEPMSEDEAAIDEEDSEDVTPLDVEITVADDSSGEDDAALDSDALSEAAAVADEEAVPDEEALTEDDALAEDDAL